MDRPGVQQVPEGSGEQGRMEKTGCKIICGAPTTLAVKGLTMMMMMKHDFRTKKFFLEICAMFYFAVSILARMSHATL